MTAKKSATAPIQILPNLEAEIGVLAILLSENNMLPAIAEKLRPEHFGDTFHGVIYQAIATLVSEGLGASPVTLRARIETHPTYTEVDGATYLIRLQKLAPPASEAMGYVTAILENHGRRTIVAVAEGMLTDALSSSTPIISVAEASTARLGSVTESLAGGTARKTRYTFEEAITQAIDHAAAAYQNEGAHPNAVMSGIRDLDRHMGGFMPGDLVVIAGRPGMGKEQPIDTPVLTPTGWRHLGSILPGDYVIGAAGEPTRVNAVFPQGQKQAYRVTFADGTSTECGLEHLWNVYPNGGRNRRRPQTKPLSDLLKSGVLSQKPDNRRGAKWRVPTVAPVVYSKQPIALPIHPYVLGVLLGDGYLTGFTISFSVPPSKAQILEKVCEIIGPQRLTGPHGSPSSPQWNIIGTKTGVSEVRRSLASLNLLVHSKDRFIPAEYLVASVDERVELLRGLMDTDGSSKGGRTVFFSASLRLANDVAEIVRSLSGIASVRYYERSNEQKSGQYVVRIRTPFCPFHIDYKAKDWRKSATSRYIVSIEPSRITEQACISVDAHDGLYVTNDFIVTHNSMLAANVCYSAARHNKPAQFNSLEMNAPQLAVRQISSAMHHPKVPYSRILKGKFSDAEFASIVETARAIKAMPLEINDLDRASLAHIEIVAARYKTENPAFAVMAVDYLQIMATASSSRSSNRTEEIGAITAGLKQLGKRLGIPILALSQVSRQVEQREDKRPTLADLRESGSIEQDADVIIFPFREDYYLARQEPKPDTTEHIDWQDRMNRVRNTMELIVAKYKMGATTTIKVGVDMATNSITDINNDQGELL